MATKMSVVPEDNLGGAPADETVLVSPARAGALKAIGHLRARAPARRDATEV
jgi:hypothetical protein